ncbi:MAG: hypothetical protein HLUCCA11_17560 [Phormidesmis priestleyi Ana]|uniref:Uncharacterized protein n=1 Tax=Phormidesmis priestleyi Ana TaxID=1666911 RepID=A0A0P8DC61_9CYAN|nr:MAG: hypothetical protein HLUCCA11_17560 [Phormidesmis priestleyi Ana]
MNIKLIDQALTAAITGLIYGSEIWFTYALSLYVVRRSLSRSHPGTIQIDIFPSAKKPVEVAVEQALLEPALKLTLKPALEQPVTSQSILSTQNSLDLPLIAPALPITEVTKVIKSQKNTLITQHAISCEPVNWKQWKVSDLRKANIAKACGVRTRPINSSRNLIKADLIAQYEQNLRRFTQAPPKVAVQKNRIA